MPSTKRLIIGLLYSAKLVAGLAIYVVTRKTPAFAYQSLIHLFCMTHGRSNDLLSRLIGRIKRPYQFSEAKGVLGDMAGPERTRVVNDLRERGFHVFEQRLPEALCQKLLQFATTHRCIMRPLAGQKGAPVEAVYHRGAPQVIRYDFTAQDLLNNPDMQRLLADLSFAAIAQDYLGSRPLVDVVSMWWHTDFGGKPDEEAAQFYHFDMDRPKWLKFFIYLTDVETTNGPHNFVAGSHKTDGIPASLLKKGYARLTDEEVASHFAQQDIMEFAAPCGTVIAEDTRGLHKGKHVQEGDRLMLQIQFSNSLFGTGYPTAKLGQQLDAALSERIKAFPDLYAAYR